MRIVTPQSPNPMRKLYDRCKLLLLISSIAVTIMSGVAVYHFDQLLQQGQPVLGEFQQLVAQSRADEQMLGKQLNLDAQEAHRGLLEASLTAMEARKASKEERRVLGEASSAFLALINHADATVQGVRETNLQLQAHLDTVSDSANETLQSFPPALQKAEQDMDALNRDLSDPNIQKFLENSNGIVADAKKKADELVAPPTKKALAFNWLETAMKVYFFIRP